MVAFQNMAFRISFQRGQSLRSPYMENWAYIKLPKIAVVKGLSRFNSIFYLSILFHFS